MLSELKRPAVVVSLVFLAIQTAWLGFLGVSVPFQLSIVVVVVAVTWAGQAFIRPVLLRVADAPARVSLSFLTGMATLTVVSTILLHEEVGGVFGLSTPTAAARGSAVLVVGAGVVLRCIAPSGHGPKPASGDSHLVWIGLAGAALVMGVLTIHGVGNGPGERLLNVLPPDYPEIERHVPDWGRDGDYIAHLVQTPRQIVTLGLPGNIVSHRGVQVWTISISLPLNGGLDPLGPLKAAKVVAVAVWFALLAIGHFVFSRLFGLSSWVSAVGTASLALFAPINIPLLKLTESSYRGLVHSSGGMYHNITQLYSVALGVGAVALIGMAVRERTLVMRFFALGTGLLAISAWFKPALFIPLAPVIGVFALLRLRRDRNAALLGSVILAVPIVGLLIYPTIVGVEHYDTGAAISVLGGYDYIAAQRFPEFVSSSIWSLGLVILAASFAAWIIPVSAWVSRSIQGLRIRKPLRRSDNEPALLSVMLMAALVVGLIVAFIFVEPAKVRAGNFKWPVAAAYVLALPVLFKLITEIRSRWWRWLTWGIVALHLWAGMVHLSLVVSTGRL